ncbi:STR1 [Scenedesmus sp. PABB004]|nr:STR1 [Scenedesmus sp. PABB004]
MARAACGSRLVLGLALLAAAVAGAQATNGTACRCTGYQIPSITDWLCTPCDESISQTFTPDPCCTETAGWQWRTAACMVKYRWEALVAAQGIGGAADFLEIGTANRTIQLTKTALGCLCDAYAIATNNVNITMPATESPKRRADPKAGCPGKGRSKHNAADDPDEECLLKTWRVGGLSSLPGFTGCDGCWGRCNRATGACPSSSCQANMLGTEENSCPHSANCPVAGKGATCEPLVQSCAGDKCLGTVRCGAHSDCGEWEGVACFFDGASDNWKVCSSDACTTGPAPAATDFPDACTLPTWYNYTVPAGHQGPGCKTTSGGACTHCAGSCCLDNGTWCPLKNGAQCVKAANCGQNVDNCLGKVHCNGNGCPGWEGSPCFYLGSSNNWKVCWDPACDADDGKAKDKAAVVDKCSGKVGARGDALACNYPSWRLRPDFSGVSLAGFPGRCTDLGGPTTNESACIGNCDPLGVCRSSSCVANALGDMELSCPHSANCPVRDVAGVECKATAGCAGPHCFGWVKCPRETCVVDGVEWHGRPCFYDGLSRNYKVCVSPKCDELQRRSPLATSGTGTRSMPAPAPAPKPPGRGRRPRARPRVLLASGGRTLLTNTNVKGRGKGLAVAKLKKSFPKAEVDNICGLRTNPNDASAPSLEDLGGEAFLRTVALKLSVLKDRIENKACEDAGRTVTYLDELAIRAVNGSGAAPECDCYTASLLLRALDANLADVTVAASSVSAELGLPLDWCTFCAEMVQQLSLAGFTPASTGRRLLGVTPAGAGGGARRLLEVTSNGYIILDATLGDAQCTRRAAPPGAQAVANVESNFSVPAAAAAVASSLALAPSPSAHEPVDTAITITATYQEGTPLAAVAGRAVRFTIVYSGGGTATVNATTNAAGTASVQQLTRSAAEHANVTAATTDSQGNAVRATTSVDWFGTHTLLINVPAPTTRTVGEAAQASAKLVCADSGPGVGANISFTFSAPSSATLTASCLTNAAGSCTAVVPASATAVTLATQASTTNACGRAAAIPGTWTSSQPSITWTAPAAPSSPPSPPTPPSTPPPPTPPTPPPPPPEHSSPSPAPAPADGEDIPVIAPTPSPSPAPQPSPAPERPPGPPAGADLALALAPAPAPRVRVRETITATALLTSGGAPVAGAPVSFAVAFADGATTAYTRTTSAAGAASLELLQPSPRNATVAASAALGGAAASAAPLALEWAADGEPIEATGGQELLLSVLDPLVQVGSQAAVQCFYTIDGRPQAGALVSFVLTHPDTGAPEGRTYSALTDALGVARVSVDASAAPLVRAPACSAGETRHLLNAGSSRTIRWAERRLALTTDNARLPAGVAANLCARFVEDAAPAVGRAVTFSVAWADGTSDTPVATTDSRGAACVPLVAQRGGDAATVTARAPGADGGAVRSVSLGLGASPDGAATAVSWYGERQDSLVVVVLTPRVPIGEPATVEAEMRDGAGAPRPGEEVTFQLSDLLTGAPEGPTLSDTTDAGGRARVDIVLDGGGRKNVVVTVPDPETALPLTAFNDPSGGGGGDVTWSRELLTLRLAPSARVRMGTPVTLSATYEEDGAPVAGAAVSFSVAFSDGTHDLRTASTDRHGVAALSLVQPLPALARVVARVTSSRGHVRKSVSVGDGAAAGGDATTVEWYGDASPPSPSPAPVKGPELLLSLQPSARVPVGTPVVVAAQYTDLAGTPVVGRPVVLSAAFTDGATRTVRRRTDAQGQASITLVSPTITVAKVTASATAFGGKLPISSTGTQLTSLTKTVEWFAPEVKITSASFRASLLLTKAVPIVELTCASLARTGLDAALAAGVQQDVSACLAAKSAKRALPRRSISVTPGACVDQGADGVSVCFTVSIDGVSADLEATLRAAVRELSTELTAETVCGVLGKTCAVLHNKLVHVAGSCAARAAAGCCTPAAFPPTPGGPGGVCPLGPADARPAAGAVPWTGTAVPVPGGSCTVLSCDVLRGDACFPFVADITQQSKVVGAATVSCVGGKVVGSFAAAPGFALSNARVQSVCGEAPTYCPTRLQHRLSVGGGAARAATPHSAPLAVTSAGDGGCLCPDGCAPFIWVDADVAADCWWGRGSRSSGGGSSGSSGGGAAAAAPRRSSGRAPGSAAGACLRAYRAAADPVVSTAWLAARLGDVAVLDVRGEVTTVAAAPGEEESSYAAAYAAYLEGHVPGAVFWDWTATAIDAGAGTPLQLETAPDLLAAALEAKGVGSDRPVVVYDGGDGMLAARLWWSLTVAGHPEALVLEGGWARWRAEGRPSELHEPCTLKVYATFEAEMQPQLRATLDDVAAIVRGEQQQGALLLDTRSAAQFNGEVRRGPRGGCVPGAVSLPRPALLGDADGWFKPLAEQRRLLEAAGVVFPGDGDGGSGDGAAVVAYCNGGVAACTAALALHRLGHRRWAVYDGSWNEYSRASELPVERAEP